MRVLFFVLVLCLCALLWTAVSAARHIRRHETKKASEKDRTKEQLGNTESGTPDNDLVH
jgi:hypothetical protein